MVYIRSKTANIKRTLHALLIYVCKKNRPITCRV